MLKLNLRFFGEGDDPAPLNPTEVQPTEPTQAPETPVAEQSKAEPITITQEALNALDMKARTAGERKILKQLNLASEGDLPALLEKLQSIRDAEEKAELEKPEIERLQAGLTAAEQQVVELKQRAADAEAKSTKLERETYLQGKGFTGRDLKGALAEINELLTDDTEWMTVAGKYVEDNPLPPPPPEMPAGTGNSKIPGIPSKEDLKGMSYEERLRLKNPAMYTEYIKNKK